jgi:hypothetical protein
MLLLIELLIVVDNHMLGWWVSFLWHHEFLQLFWFIKVVVILLGLVRIQNTIYSLINNLFQINFCCLNPRGERFPNIFALVPLLGNQFSLKKLFSLVLKNKFRMGIKAKVLSIMLWQFYYYWPYFCWKLSLLFFHSLISLTYLQKEKLSSPSSVYTIRILFENVVSLIVFLVASAIRRRMRRRRRRSLVLMLHT